MSGCPFNFTRRKFFGLAGAVTAVAAGFGARGVIDGTLAHGSTIGFSDGRLKEPFFGDHQSGILTPAQGHSYFAALDVVTDKRADLIAMLQRWTEASEKMARGSASEPDPVDATPDTEDVKGLSPCRLTITFGFGPSFFSKDGKDRFGISHLRPEALAELPPFANDQLAPEKTGGDISIQACADDPQVAFHAVRQLVRLADYVAKIRWTQTAFVANPPAGGTPRNLLGFKDGTANPSAKNKDLMDQFVWAGAEAPLWMQGGSYMVARRARIALEHWDKMKVSFQEQVVGRKKETGAPLGRKNEFDTANLDAMDSEGEPFIAENSHLRLATAATNEGAQILRRSYSYNDGVNLTAERWPPWRQGMEYDAGLFFMCYQRDPRTGFIKIFDKMSKFDLMNQFVTHVGGGLFACPRGIAKGEYLAQALFQAA